MIHFFFKYLDKWMSLKVGPGGYGLEVKHRGSRARLCLGLNFSSANSLASDKKDIIIVLLLGGYYWGIPQGVVCKMLSTRVLCILPIISCYYYYYWRTFDGLEDEFLLIFPVTLMVILQKCLSYHVEFSELKTSMLSLVKVTGSAQRPPWNVALGHFLSPWPQPWLCSVLGSWSAS